MEKKLCIQDEDRAASVCWHLLKMGRERIRLDDVYQDLDGYFVIKFRCWNDEIWEAVSEMIDSLRGEDEPIALPARDVPNYEALRANISAIEYATVTMALLDPKIGIPLEPKGHKAVVVNMCLDAVESKGELVSPLTMEWIETMMAEIAEEDIR